MTRSSNLEDEAMRAVRIYAYGGPETLKYQSDVPEPAVGANDILIEAAATSINPIDWKVRSGARVASCGRSGPTSGPSSRTTG